MKLIEPERRRQAWKHFTTWSLIALAGLPAAWELIPPDTKANLPPNLRDWIQILIALYGAFGKFIEQKPRAPRRPRSRP